MYVCIIKVHSIETHGRAFLGLPALVALPAAFFMLPLPGSSMVTTSPTASYPIGALPVVIGSELASVSTSAEGST